MLLFAAQSMSAAVAVVTTPIIALGLGGEPYGLYVVLFGLVSYLSILDLGLSFSVVKQVAEHDPQTERPAIEALLGTAATIYLIIASILVVTLVSGREWIARSFLRIAEPLIPVAETAIIILACGVPVTMFITLLNGALRGLLRFEYVTMFSVITATVFSTGAAVLVWSGTRVEVVFGLHLGLVAVSAMGHWVVARRFIPGLRIVLGVHRTELQRLFRFGRFMMINQLSMMALLNLDKLLIARILSVSMVGYYTVPFSLSQKLNTLGAATATVAFPLSSAHLSRGEVEELRRGYFQASRMLGWVTMALALPTIVFAEPILRFWMNGAFATHGTVPLRFLAGAMWIASVASLDAVCIEGSGRPNMTALFMAVTGVVNIVGIVTLTPLFGLAGAACSVFIAHVGLAALDVWCCNRYVLKLGLGKWGRAVALPTAMTTLISTPILLGLGRIPSSLWSLVGVLVAGGTVTIAVGYIVFLAPHERRSVLAEAGRLVASVRT